MADNKICFSDVKMAGNAGNTEIITAADKTVYGFTGDNDSDNYGLLTALFQLRYFTSSVIYRQQTDDIQLIFRNCTEYSPVLRELRTDNYIIPAGDIADRFRPFVHDHPVVFLDPPADNAAAITDKELNTAAQGLFSMVVLIRRIISSYSKFSKSEKPEEINGLVFIAMPERHLDILWHEHCIPLLQATFPKTVFYLTTQSPVILSQLNDGEAYRLFRDSGEIIRTQKYS